MKIGFMNSPFRAIEDEFKFGRENGFDFMELTVEPPRSALEGIRVDSLNRLSEENRLPLLIGHSAWYLPYANPLVQLHQACLAYAEKCLDVFRALGIGVANIHTNFFYSVKVEEEIMANHLNFLRQLVEAGKKRGIKIMLEPLGTTSESPELITRIFSEVEDLYFHFDIGHANLLEPEGGLGLLRELRDRLLHVHLSDNNGREDLHLPIGCGNAPFTQVLTYLKNTGYNKTFTIEVFSPDRDYLLLSKDKFRKMWREE